MDNDERNPEGTAFDYEAFKRALETTRQRMDDDGNPVGITLDPSEEELRISAEIDHPWWCDRRRCSAWDGGCHHSDPEMVLPDRYSDITVQVWLTHEHGSEEPVLGHAVIDLPWPHPDDPDERIVLTMRADRLTLIGQAFTRAPEALNLAPTTDK
ncbi:MAG TPA: hypothetical protein VEO53_14800 [Candidatus Binatia bacterium]|nr:hypothetical protein [Candidatus Binatia bacterium]